MSNQQKVRPAEKSPEEEARNTQQIETTEAVTRAVSVKPIRSSTREFVVELPCGVFKDGKVYRSVRLRTLTAADRRLFGEAKLQKSPAKIITKLLVSKIVEIEGIPSVTENTLRQMIGFDRDYLIYVLRKETTRERPFFTTFKCRGDDCGAKNEVEFEIAELEQEGCLTMTDAERLRVENGMCVFDVELPEYDFKAKCRYSDGNLQEFLSGRIDESTNPYDLEVELLAQLVLDFNGEGQLSAADYNGENGEEPLDLEFMDDLQEAIRAQRKGFELNPKAKCYKCGHENRVRVEPLDFLLDGSSRKRIGTSTR